MDRGTYVSASGGLAQFRKLEIVNNNLANVNTPGFKREVLVTDMQEFDQTLASEIAKNDPYAKADHDRTPGVVNMRAVTDFTPGPIKSTGNTLDLALPKKNQFFVVNTPEGEQFTRAGNFTLNAEGEIATADGFQILGDGGAISADGPGLKVFPDGTVQVNKEKVGQIRIVETDDPSQFERAGGTRFKLKTGGQPPVQVENPEVITNSLEMSNVSTISSVLDMISANRAFEMYTKTAQSIDQMNQTAVNQIGRPR